MPAVSVIIPNYNHASFLTERIESVLSQQFDDFEIILLDDASADNSMAVLEQYRNHPKVSQLIINKINSGSPFSQWKKGISLAAGKWIWIAESDDKADPMFLETALSRLDQQPGASLFYCDAWNTRTDNQPASFTRYAEARKKIFESILWDMDYEESGIAEINLNLKWACSINNISSVVFKKRILDEELTDTELFRFHGDWYYLLRVCSRGDILYSSATLNHFRMKPDSVQQGDDMLRSKTEYFRILNWLWQQPFVSDKNKLLDFFILQYTGYGFIKEGISHGRQLMKKYREINAELARLMYRRMIRLKFTGKKRKPLF